MTASPAGRLAASLAHASVTCELALAMDATLEASERELARVVVEVGEGRHAAAAPMIFTDLLDRWLDVKRRTVEANTMRRTPASDAAW